MRRTGVLSLAAALAAATLSLSAAAARPAANSMPRGVHGSFLSAVAPCSAHADASCASDAVARTAAGLGRRIQAQPSGRAGLASSIRLAASLNGTPVRAGEAVPQQSLEAAIVSLYRSAGIAVTPSLQRRVRSTVAGVRAAAAREASRIIGAAAEANRLAARATAGSGIETLARDPGRAMRIASYATKPKGSVPEALRRESIRNAAILGRVDMRAMATAAALTADAFAAFDETAFRGGDDIDLPFIFIGGEGDTVHSDNRLLSIDMSGNDTWANNAGGGLAAIVGGSFAADLGTGTDLYEGPDSGAQGWGLGVPGILYDEGGADTFWLRQFGQGAGVGGVGVLYNAGDGNDYFDSAGAQPIGTKAASLGGMGLFVDEAGDDYIRQDALDGFVWAGGGISLMLNLGDGSDTYRADSHPQPPILCTEPPCPNDYFAGPIQVSAEVTGIALLYEEGGDDSYTCGEFVRQGCQGAAGSSSFALLWDRGGNDTYWMGDTFSVDFVDAFCGEPCSELPRPIENPIFPMGQGAGYETVCVPCQPQALGILYDEDGSDSYTAARWAQGYGANGGTGILRDAGGDADSYSMQPPLSGSRADGQAWVDGIIGIGVDD